MSSKVQLPPHMLPMGEMFSTSFKVFMKAAGQVFGLMGLLFVWTGVTVGGYMGLAYAAKFVTMTTTTIDISTLGIVTGVVFLLLLLVGSLHLIQMMTKMIYAHIQGMPITFGTAWTASLKRLVPYTLTTVLTVVIMLAFFLPFGAMLFISNMYTLLIVGLVLMYTMIPLMVIACVYLAWASEVSAIENSSVMESIKGSYWIVRGRWWTLVGYLITFQLLMMLALAPFLIANMLVQHWATSLLYLIVAIVVSSYMFILALVFYVRMRDTAVKKPVAGSL